MQNGNTTMRESKLHNSISPTEEGYNSDKDLKFYEGLSPILSLKTNKRMVFSTDHPNLFKYSAFMITCPPHIQKTLANPD
jgi:hypothetical protein